MFDPLWVPFFLYFFLKGKTQEARVDGFIKKNQERRTKFDQINGETIFSLILGKRTKFDKKNEETILSVLE